MTPKSELQIRHEAALEVAKDAAHKARSELAHDTDTRYADGVAAEAAIEAYLKEMSWPKSRSNKS